MKPKKKRKSVFVKKSLQYLEPPRMKSRKQKRRKLISLKLKESGKLSNKLNRSLQQLQEESNCLTRESLPNRSMTSLRKLLTILIRVKSIPWSRIRKRARKTSQKRNQRRRSKRSKIKTKMNKKAVLKKKITLSKNNPKNQKLKMLRKKRCLRKCLRVKIGRMQLNLELIKPQRKIKTLVTLTNSLIKEMTLMKK